VKNETHLCNNHNFYTIGLNDIEIIELTEKAENPMLSVCFVSMPNKFLIKKFMISNSTYLKIARSTFMVLLKLGVLKLSAGNA